MANKLAKSNKISQFNRSGSVYYRVEQAGNGESLVALAVDYEKAPTPNHTYVADFVEVSRIDSDVLIVFGKIDFPSGKSLRNKVEIYFPCQPFVYQLWKSSRDLHAKLGKAAAEKGLGAADPFAGSSETDKVQTLATNNALMVIGAGQCIVDFFLISAKDLWIKTRKGDPLNMDALVRVYASERLLLRFLNLCDEVAQGLVEELNFTFTEENDEKVESVEL